MKSEVPFFRLNQLRFFPYQFLKFVCQKGLAHGILEIF